MGTDIRLRQQIADRAAEEGLCPWRRSSADRRRCQSVEPVIGKRLGHVGIGIETRQRIAK